MKRRDRIPGEKSDASRPLPQNSSSPEEPWHQSLRRRWTQVISLLSRIRSSLRKRRRPRRARVAPVRQFRALLFHCSSRYQEVAHRRAGARAASSEPLRPSRLAMRKEARPPRHSTPSSSGLRQHDVLMIVERLPQKRGSSVGRNPKPAADHFFRGEKLFCPACGEIKELQRVRFVRRDEVNSVLRQEE